MGLSGTQPSQHTVGFIRLFTIKPTFTIRTNQANIWVYLALNQAIIHGGLLRLSNQGLHMDKTHQDIIKPIYNWVYQAAKAVER